MLILYYIGYSCILLNETKYKIRLDRANTTIDNKIETIYPIDFRLFKEGIITPLELEQILKPAKDTGTKLTIILDI